MTTFWTFCNCRWKYPEINVQDFYWFCNVSDTVFCDSSEFLSYNLFKFYSLKLLELDKVINTNYINIFFSSFRVNFFIYFNAVMKKTRIYSQQFNFFSWGGGSSENLNGWRLNFFVLMEKMLKWDILLILNRMDSLLLNQLAPDHPQSKFNSLHR